MKYLRKRRALPWVCASLGAAAGLIRRLLYTFGLDQRGLLIPRHPLSLALTILTLGTLAYIVWSVLSLDGSNRYRGNFPASSAAALGHFLAAAGFGATVLFNESQATGLLGLMWRVLGLASVPCLILAGLDRRRGKPSLFLAHLIPCLFLMAHIVCHYRSWSSDPQALDYLFALLGAMSLMFFAFYTAAFEAGAGRRRMQLGMGLAAVYLCLTELFMTEYPALFLAGALWAFTGLCALEPRQHTPKAESGEAP